MRKKTFLFFFGLFCSVFICYSQVTKDFGFWNTLNFEHKLTDELNLSLTQEIRFKENVSRLNRFYTQLGLEYKLAKKVKTSLSYRFTQRLEDENYFSLRHRLIWDLNFKKSVDKFTFSYRHRLQSEVKKYYSSKLGKLPEWFYRHKLQVKYELNKRIEPYFATEAQIQLYDAGKMVDNNELNRVRFKVGTDIKLSAKKTFGIYYGFQNEFATAKENDIYILGLEYSIKF